MRRLAFLVSALIIGCSAQERPWDKPWPSEPREGVESRTRLPSGRYPIDLVTVLRLAGADNLEIAYFREKAREAYAGSQLAWERFIPWVGPVFAFRRHQGLTQATDGTFVEVNKQQTFAGGDLHLHWEVGDALYASMAASQRYDASLESIQAVENLVLLQAAVAYFDLLREQRRIQIVTEEVTVEEELEAQLQRAYEAKRAFRGDVLRARVQASNAKIARERSREALRLAAIRLASILRLAPGIELEAVEQDLQRLDLIAPSVPETDLIRDAMAARPEIRAASAELAATRHEQTGAVWGPLFPMVDADAAPGWLGPNPANFDSTGDYYVTLGWRIGPGGLFDFGRRNLADAKVRQSEIQLERIRQRVVDELRSAWTQMHAASEILALAESEVIDAKTALDLNVERQKAQIGLPLEVLQAQEAYARARLDRDTAIVEFNQAQVRLRAALGRKP